MSVDNPVAVPVAVLVRRPVHGEPIDVDDVRPVHRVAPAQAAVVADGGQRRAEEAGAGEVQALVAHDVCLVAEVERGVRIDEQQCIAVCRARRRDTDRR